MALTVIMTASGMTKKGREIGLCEDFLIKCLCCVRTPDLADVLVSIEIPGNVVLS